jgi:hypothetical protein
VVVENEKIEERLVDNGSDEIDHRMGLILHGFLQKEVLGTGRWVAGLVEQGQNGQRLSSCWVRSISFLILSAK